jgi:fucose permease
MSIQLASILAGATAVGRIGAGFMLRRVPWYLLLNLCVVAMGLLVVLTLPLAAHVVKRIDVGWTDAPIAAYLIPLIGLLMAPIYPVINSVALSSLPKPVHAAMTGLIVVFSALGGTLSGADDAATARAAIVQTRDRSRDGVCAACNRAGGQMRFCCTG